MTLSLFLLIFLAIIIISSIVLPYNKINYFLRILLVPSALFFILIIVDTFTLKVDIASYLGKSTIILWSWLLDGYRELSYIDYYHISGFLSLGLFYLVIMLFSFIIVNSTFLGSNPNLQKHKIAVKKIFSSFGFCLLSFSTIAIFLAEIREIIPLASGFLNPIFNIFYKFGVIN